MIANLFGDPLSRNGCRVNAVSSRSTSLSIRGSSRPSELSQAADLLKQQRTFGIHPLR